MWKRILFFSLLPCLLAAQKSASSPAWKNPHLPAAVRAADLVSHMTLEEKVSQMQNSAPAIPRLGIPAYDWWNEGLHGVARAGLATVFPQAIGLSSTWNAALMHQIATVISTEARAKYNYAIAHNDHSRYHGLTFWSPNINLVRDPRWGRGQETYGEDPFLTGSMAVAFIRGMQGNNPHYFKTIATAKHFAMYSGPEPARHSIDVIPRKIDLGQTYFVAFRMAIQEGHVDSVMCSYNAVMGVPSCANKFLLEQTLRKKWGFKGYVVSDCGAIGDIYQGHKYAPTAMDAAIDGVEAGTDLSCLPQYTSLVQAVEEHKIPVADINRAVTRLFTARFRLGMFDPPSMVPWSKVPYSQVDSPAHRALALKAARESIVLLKNDGHALPLSPSIRSIAVIGPSANDPDELLGNYNGIPSHLITPLVGLRHVYAGRAKIDFALGATYTPATSALVPDTVLTTTVDGKTVTGLRAQYFTNATFSGAPAVSRIEPDVYVRWQMEDPALKPYLHSADMSVRWTGAIRVDQTGDYQLGPDRLACGECKGFDSATLYVNGKMVATDAGATLWQDHFQGGVVHLVAGEDYPIRLDYVRKGRSAGFEFHWLPPAQLLIQQAVEAAKHADVTLAFVGLNSGLEGEEMKVDLPGFRGGDRTRLDLPTSQQALLDALFATGKPVIVVLQSGSAIALKDAAQRAQAVLECWYGGEAGGLAIAQTIDGSNNPAGRLPITFYQSVNQLPPFTDYSMVGRTYRYFRGKPLYPFGYGLSYSSFHYADMTVHPAARGGFEVSVRVTNTSQRAGDEVVEMYVTRDHDLDAPIRSLAGFTRIHLAAGASREVSFHLGRRAIESPSRTYHRLLISVGGGQPLAGWPGVSFVEDTVPVSAAETRAQ